MKRYLSRGLLALLLTAPFGASEAAAQRSSAPPSLEKTVPVLPLESAQPAPEIETEAPLASGSPVTGRFVLGAVLIDGATVFEPATLAEDFESLLASQVGDEELSAIAERITQRYRAAGYPFSYAIVPAQDVRSGIVKIRVVEGFICDVRIEGAGRSLSAVRALVEPLTRDQPLRTRTLQRVLGLVRDVPGVVVTDTQVTRPAADPSRLSMTIVVKEDRGTALLYLDNRGTSDRAPLRLYSSARLHSLVTSGDALQIDVFGIPGDHYHLLYGKAEASIPLGHDGMRLGAAASWSDSGQPVSGRTYSDKSRNFLSYLSHPILRSQATTLTGRVTLNDWQNEARLAHLPFSRERLRVARLSIHLTHKAAARIDALLTFSKSFDLARATRFDNPLAPQTVSNLHFAKSNFDIQATWPLSDRLAFRLSAAGQYSSRPLLPIEEFSLGGPRFGRVFDYSAVTGDHGLGAAAELGYRIGDVGRGPRNVEMFGSIDGGAAFRTRLIAEPRKRHQELMSASAGVRFVVAGFASSLEVGMPVKGLKQQSGPRVFFSLWRAV